MRIALFTNNYLPNPYGVSTSVDGFYRGLKAAGHEVFIFAPDWRGADDHNDENIFRYPSVDVPTKVPFSLALPYAPEMDRKIESMSFDIIHAQHPNILGGHAAHWARKKKVPLVFTWHSLYDRYTHYVSLIPERIASRWVMENAVGFARKADRVIFPTVSVCEQLRAKIDHDRISIVASGVDEELFAHPRPTEIREKYGIPADAKLLVSISRLSEEKNVIFLARSMRRFLMAHEDVYLLLCGDGDLTEDVRKIFADKDLLDRVVMPGAIAREDVKHHLSASDVFVYASTSETQGTVITEAMYCGVPIVAIRASGVKDVVEDGVSGIMVKEVIGDFVYALEKVVYDDAYRKSLSQAAHARAHGEFTVIACTQRLLGVYAETIKIYDDHRGLS